jgi:hypothetical protein
MNWNFLVYDIWISCRGTYHKHLSSSSENFRSYLRLLIISWFIGYEPRPTVSNEFHRSRATRQAGQKENSLRLIDLCLLEVRELRACRAENRYSRLLFPDHLEHLSVLSVTDYTLPCRRYINNSKSLATCIAYRKEGI